MIIKSNLARFEDAFRDKATFDRHILAVQEAHNALAHHRDMNEGEQHMAKGAVLVRGLPAQRSL
jgi:hypothetical protein